MFSYFVKVVLDTFCGGMVWSLYFYFIFSSFLANKGLLNLKRKTCLGGGVECYCSLHLQLLCQTLLPCCGEFTPPRYLQANAFQSHNSRLSSQKYWDKAIWSLTSLTSVSSMWSTVPVMTYQNIQLSFQPVLSEGISSVMPHTWNDLYKGACLYPFCSPI